MQIPNHPGLHVLTYHVTKLEQSTDTALNIITAEIKSELRPLESGVIDLSSNTNRRFTTLYRDIESLSNGLLNLTHHFLELEDGLSQVQVTLRAQTETFTKLGRGHNFSVSRLDCLARPDAQAVDRLTRLESAPDHPVPQAPANLDPKPSVFAYPPPFPAAWVAIPRNADYNPPDSNVPTTVAQLFPVSQPPDGAYDGSVPCLQPLETDIDDFRSVIYYRRYLLTHCAVYIDPNADLSLHKVKRKVYILYPIF